MSLTLPMASSLSGFAASFYECEPPFLAVGTEVSAKYKGAFCEARIKKVIRLVKCRISFRNNGGSAVVSDDNVKGTLRVGAHVEAKHPDKNQFLDGVISKIIDASQYTVVFDDEDEATLRRTSLCLKSGKHFAESESLDHLPLTNPEHFGNPVNRKPDAKTRRKRNTAVDAEKKEEELKDDEKTEDEKMDDDRIEGEKKDDDKDDEKDSVDDKKSEKSERSERSERSEKSEKNGVVDEEEKINLPPRKYKRKVGAKPGRRKGTKSSVVDGDNESVVGGEADERSKTFDENSDSEGESDLNSKTPTISKDEAVNIGDRIRVKYGKGKQLKVYEAKILQESTTDSAKGKYFVHYTGWNTRYDEWISRQRIVEVVRDKAPKRRGGNKQKNKGVPINPDTGECIEPPAKESKETKDASTTAKRGRPQSANSKQSDSSKSNKESSKKDSKSNSVSSGKRSKQKIEKTDSQESLNEKSNSPPAIVPSSPTEEAPQLKAELTTALETKVKTDSKDVVDTVVQSKKKVTSNVQEHISDNNSVSEKCISEEVKAPAIEEKFDDKLLTCSESLDKSPPPKLTQFDDALTDCESPEEEKFVKKPEKSSEERKDDNKDEDEKQDKTVNKPVKRKRKETVKKEKKRSQEKLKEVSPKKKKSRKTKDGEEQSNAEDVKEKPKLGKKRKKSIAAAEGEDPGGSEIQDTGGTVETLKTTKRKRSTGTLKSKSFDNGNKSETSWFEAKSEPPPLPKKRAKKDVEEKKKDSEAKDQEDDVNLEIASIFEDLPSKAVYLSSSEKTSNNEITNEGTSFLLCKEEVPASPVQLSEHNIAEHSVGEKSQTASTSSLTISETETAVISQQSQPSCNSSCDEKETKECSIDATPVDCPQFTFPTTPDSLKSSSVNSLTPPHENSDSERHPSQFNTQHTIHGSSSNSEGEQSDVSSKIIANMSPATITHHSRPELPTTLNINSPPNHSDDSCSRHAQIDSSATKKTDVGSPVLISPLTSPKKRRRGRTRTSSTSELGAKEPRTASLKTRGYTGRRTRQQIDTSDVYTMGNDANGPLSPTAPSINLSNYSPNAFVYCVTPTSKYNFCTPINENLETDKRIQILSERLQELKRTYLSIKAEVASIERRRKKAKKKDKDRNSPMSSPQSEKHLINGERTAKLSDDSVKSSSQTTATSQESLSNGPSNESAKIEVT